MGELQDKMVEYRAKERISQAELARRCKLSLSTINAIEAGAQVPTMLTFNKIVDIIEGN